MLKRGLLLALAVLLGGCRADPPRVATEQIETGLRLTLVGVELTEPLRESQEADGVLWQAACRLHATNRLARLPRLPLALPAPKPWALRLETVQGRPVLSLRAAWRWPVEADSQGGTTHLLLRTRGSLRHDSPTEPGLSLRRVETFTDAGPQRLWAVRLPADQLYRLRVVTAGPALQQKQPVTTIAGPTAAAALNGGYFEPETGAPLGALKIGDEWLAQPLYQRTCLLLPSRGRARITALRWRAEVQTPLLKLPIEAFNATPAAAAVCAVTTRRWDGAAAFPGLQRTPLAGSDLVVHHRQPLDGAPAVVLATEPPADGSVLGGGPRLLADGAVAVSAAAEQFQPDVAASVTARSGVGIARDGAVWLACGEARRPWSRGYSLDEWAQAFRELGCVDAMNLDGGTSATLVVHGRVQGEPAGGAPAAVANALVVTSP